jgi:hypothetical protein
MSARRRLPWAVLPLLLLVGCNRPNADLAAVQGRVFYQGKPLAGGTVVFTPDPERGGSGPLAVAAIQPDGRYTLTTEGRPGAVPGWHRVTVAPPSPAEGGTLTCDLPCRYRDPERSGQCYEVKAGEANAIDLRLE